MARHQTKVSALCSGSVLDHPEPGSDGRDDGGAVRQTLPSGHPSLSALSCERDGGLVFDFRFYQRKRDRIHPVGRDYQAGSDAVRHPRSSDDLAQCDHFLPQHGGGGRCDGGFRRQSRMENPVVSPGDSPDRSEWILGGDSSGNSGNPVSGYRPDREQRGPDPVFFDAGDVDGVQHSASGMDTGIQSALSRLQYRAKWIVGRGCSRPILGNCSVDDGRWLVSGVSVVGPVQVANRLLVVRRRVVCPYQG